MPHPPRFVDLNGAKSELRMKWSDIPGPVSPTESTAQPFSSLVRTVSIPPPGSRASVALVIRFCITRRIASESP